MFFHSSRGRRIGTTVLMAGVATISVFSLTGCSTTPSDTSEADQLKTELESRGFINVSYADATPGYVVRELFVGAGGCRGIVNVPRDYKASMDFFMHYAGADNKSVDFISPASVTVVTDSEALAFCADSEPFPVSTEAPTPAPSDTE
jgi:hypothetical protein